MSFFQNAIKEFRYLRTILGMLKGVKDVSATSTFLMPDEIEASVDKHRNNLAFVCDDQKWLYSDFETYANRTANWALAQGLRPGDTVSIFVQNRLEYVALWFGLSKVGVIPALINFQLRAKPLAHCLTISKTKLAIVDHELLDDWQSAQKHLDKPIKGFVGFGGDKIKSKKSLPLENFDAQIKVAASTRPDRSHREGIVAGDVFMKMFTSGTTGMPKAALMAHTRGQFYMRGFTLPSKSNAKDRMMMVLPLYHATGGLCGVGTVLTKGGALIVVKKFSVSQFWEEAAEHGATLFMYVGELCRFLLNAPAKPSDKTHNIRCIIGNGLGRQVWEEFETRFGIKHVVEFYGATEGNISLFNFEGPAGAVGRIPEYLRSRMNGDLIAYDIETGEHIIQSDGFYRRTTDGEIGELIGEIKQDEARFSYKGYQNKEASDKKILHNVFKKGDQWFRTGDLLSRDAQGYYYFSDRIGDTYRWKAENVSTGEVAAVLSGFAGINQANVYGVEVPGYGGRAGMGSLVADKDIDLDGLCAHVTDALPPYARPVFLRISSETETTSTFKYKKINLVKDGFDPARISDDLYVSLPDCDGYQKLDAKMYKSILQRELKF